MANYFIESTDRPHVYKLMRNKVAFGEFFVGFDALTTPYSLDETRYPEVIILQFDVPEGTCKLVKKGTVLSDDVYEELMLTLAACELESEDEIKDEIKDSPDVSKAAPTEEKKEKVTKDTPKDEKPVKQATNKDKKKVLDQIIDARRNTINIRDRKPSTEDVIKMRRDGQYRTREEILRRRRSN